MTIASATRPGIAGLLATLLLAAPALAQVAPGVGVGAGGASAGLGGSAGTINTTGAGTGMSAPAIGGTNNSLNSNPASLPGFGVANPGLVNPAPNGGITPPLVGYGPGSVHHGMAAPDGRGTGANRPR